MILWPTHEKDLTVPISSRGHTPRRSEMRRKYQGPLGSLDESSGALGRVAAVGWRRKWNQKKRQPGQVLKSCVSSLQLDYCGFTQTAILGT